MTESVPGLLAELASLEDPRMREVNERHGDDHGVNLGKLRAIAKRVKTNHELAVELWATDVTPARLLALLICRPKAFDADDLDRMLRESRAPKVREWLVSYIVKKSPHTEQLRLAWLGDPDAVVTAAGWDLTTERVVKQPDGIDLEGFLDTIESDMRAAPDPLQWSMNHTLAEIGISNPWLRPRAIDIGERLEVLKDYPTAPGCISPYAPIWISEMSKRVEGSRPGS